MSWLTTIVKNLDYLRGRYEAFPGHKRLQPRGRKYRCAGEGRTAP